MRYAWLLGMLWTLANLACSKDDTTSQTQAILGEDSLLSVIGEGGGSDLPLQAIGRMQGGCTAFHLGQGLVATAGHCLPAPSANMADMPCTTFSIAWHGGPQNSRCLRYIAYRHDDEADYALFEVYPAPEAQLYIEETNWAFTPEAVVLGFPRERELSVSGRCALQPSPGKRFSHSCDTLPGNSGSPVIDLATGRVLGIHNGEADSQNYGTTITALGDLTRPQSELADPVAVPQDLQFGPFGDREERLLVTLGARHGEEISFVLDIDLELDCDQLYVTDGLGRRQMFTGEREETLKLLAPVSIVLSTDYAGASQRVRLSQL